MAVDAETKVFLDDVKKGKPRYFVMISKGVKILSLIAYKKGTVEKYKKQAKQEGKGAFCNGLVAGRGENITFYLLSAEGYVKPPVKDVTLKEFLKTEADYKAKPSFEIVAVYPTTVPGAEAEEPSDAGVDAGSKDPLISWQQERTRVITQLKKIAKVVAMAKHSESAKAIIEIKGVIGNLTESPTTPQQIAELKHYLTDDDVVNDVCELTTDIREPLLQQLNKITPQPTA